MINIMTQCNYEIMGLRTSLSSALVEEYGTNVYETGFMYDS